MNYRNVKLLKVFMWMEEVLNLMIILEQCTFHYNFYDFLFIFRAKETKSF